MVADFVSVDYGWLHSPDGSESMQVLFKAGKTCDGCFTNKDIIMQTQMAMDIVQKHYPHDDIPSSSTTCIQPLPLKTTPILTHPRPIHIPPTLYPFIKCLQTCLPTSCIQNQNTSHS
ncbi:hypothetical protein L208DRAFT_1464357 [Tricholoma matsutake]|nr:hypothetical protein L208DRAFT_1464357 [Tricholoma matsutake 945]